MSAPTPDRPMTPDDTPRGGATPHVPDELDLAWQAAATLADDGRAPAAAVRANVLAVARELASDAAKRATKPADVIPPAPAPVPDPAPALDPVALTIPGIGRALAANLSSWRVRVGAGACVALLAAVVAWRFDDRLTRPDEDTTVASVDLLPSRDPRLPAPEVAPSPQLTVLPRPAASEPQPAPQVVAAAPAADVPPADAVAQEKPMVVASARQGAARSQAPISSAAETASRDARSRDRVVVAEADPRDTARFPAIAPAPKVQGDPQRVEIQGSRIRRVETEAASPITVLSAAPPAAPAALAASPVTLALAAPPAPSPAPASPVDQLQRVEITGSSIRQVDVAQPGAASGVDAPQAETRVAMAKSSGSLLSMSSAATNASTRPPALQRAADAGDAALIATLLAAGAAVDAPDADGRTALLHAVLSRHAAAVRALLAAGADPAHADATGLTPRTAAQRNGDADITSQFAPR